MKTIYTAIFGDYDDLKEPTLPKKAKGWKYVCFTNQNLESRTWEIHKVPLIDNDPVKTARYYKIMFNKVVDTELSLWIDATFVINIDLNRWWKRFTPPFTAITHPFDDCIYTDAQSCIDSGRGDRKMIERQIELYKALNIPKHNGLISSGILMRQRVGAVNEFCRLWWEQVRNWSSRDQIAFGYANYKYPGLVNRIEWDYTTQKEFIHIPHKGKPWRDAKLRETYASYQR